MQYFLIGLQLLIGREGTGRQTGWGGMAFWLLYIDNGISVLIDIYDYFIYG